jgi:hypothetical protein
MGAAQRLFSVLDGDHGTDRDEGSAACRSCLHPKARRDKVEKAVRILGKSEASVELHVIDGSLMRILSEYGVRPMRLYALLNAKEKSRLPEMQAAATHLLSHRV